MKAKNQPTQAAPTATAPAVQAAPTTTTPAAIPELRAKHVAAHLGMKQTSLRRVLRAMPEYADGVHTNYRFASLDCPEVKRIIEAVNARKAAREAAKAEAVAKVAAAAAPATPATPAKA